jgi:hypothetical protein
MLCDIEFRWNTTSFLSQTDASGTHSTFGDKLAFAFARSIHGGLQFVGEFYGETQLNRATPGFASSIWALSYTVVPPIRD